MQTVGRLLPRRISQILREIDSNLTVWINPEQGNDIDMRVWDNDELVFVAEILNWSIGSRMSEKRLTKMISNLNKFNCRELLVYTTLEQESLSKFIQNGIDVIEIGYQLLPEYYYDFFSSKKQVIKRKIDSAVTKKDIKQKIISYLERSISHI